MGQGTAVILDISVKRSASDTLLCTKVLVSRKNRTQFQGANLGVYTGQNLLVVFSHRYVYLKLLVLPNLL